MVGEAEGKQIRGHANYRIYPTGAVWSIKRKVYLQQKRDSNGYAVVRLCKNGKKKAHKVHNLVIRHFGEKKPSPSHECNHKDGNKMNPDIDNLEWATRSENAQHAYDTGLNWHCGDSHSKSKLTSEKVIKIRALHATGKFNNGQLARKFNIDRSVVSKIVNRRIWKQV